MVDCIDPDELPRTPTFSQVAIASGSKLVFTSGQVSVDKQGNVVGEGNLAEQTWQAMHNLTVALAAAGASFAQIVKTTTLVVSYQWLMREEITSAKMPFYGGRKPPTSALIGVSALA